MSVCRNICVVRCNYVVKVISNSHFFLGSTLLIVDFSHLGFHFPPFSLISNSARGVLLPIHPYSSPANLYSSLLPSYIHLGPSERLGPSCTFFSHTGVSFCACLSWYLQVPFSPPSPSLLGRERREAMDHSHQCTTSIRAGEPFLSSFLRTLLTRDPHER